MKFDQNWSLFGEFMHYVFLKRSLELICKFQTAIQQHPLFYLKSSFFKNHFVEQKPQMKRPQEVFSKEQDELHFNFTKNMSWLFFLWTENCKSFLNKALAVLSFNIQERDENRKLSKYFSKTLHNILRNIMEWTSSCLLYQMNWPAWRFLHFWPFAFCHLTN